MRPKQTRSLAIVVAVVSVLGSTGPAAAQNFPPDPLSVRMPDDAVGADVALVVSVAARLGIPFGFEEAGALSERVSMPFRTVGPHGSRPGKIVSVRPTPLDLRGVTLRAALDAVVVKDRRYSWREVNGVVVVRPVAAWRDPAHPLLRRASDVRLEDAGGSDPFESVRQVVGPEGTLLDLLNAAVRAHGHMQWSLRSDVNTIFLDRGRAVTAAQPVLSVGAGADSRTFPLLATPPPEPHRP